MSKALMLLAIYIALYQLIDSSKVRKFRYNEINFKNNENESPPGNIWNSIKDGANSTWSVIENGATSTWSAIENGANSTWNSIENGAKGLWQGVENVFKKPGARLADSSAPNPTRIKEPQHKIRITSSLNGSPDYYFKNIIINMLNLFKRAQENK